MKVVFSKALVAQFAADSTDMFNALTGEAKVLNKAAAEGELLEFKSAHQRMHYSETFECYEYEIDDVVLVRVLKLYVRVAKFIGPIVRSCMEFASSMQDEFAAIDKMLAAPSQDDISTLH